MHPDHLAPKVGNERSFGLTFAGLFAALAVYRGLTGAQLWWIYLGLAAILAGAALAAPNVLKPLNYLWFRLGLLLNRIVSPFLLAVIFFGVIVPLAYLARLRGKDGLCLRRADVQSYWNRRDPPGPRGESMTEQF